MDRRFTSSPYITVGRISGPFGIKGELKVEVLTDFPQRFEPGSRLLLAEEPVTVSSARASGPDRLIVQLDEVRSRTQAETIPRGATLDIREEDVIPLPGGAYYRFQLIGLPVVTESDNEPLGTVEDIIETGVNDVLVVRAEGRPETLIPNTDEIATIDLDNAVIRVKPIEGLIPAAEPETPQDQPTQQRRRRRRRRR
ncbi:MAG: ribosome maturation factor RimM [Chloroflexi bacterium]|nr:ribosome maturation factor RimM [Chloroflexota bacterium]